MSDVLLDLQRNLSAGIRLGLFRRCGLRDFAFGYQVLALLVAFNLALKTMLEWAIEQPDAHRLVRNLSLNSVGIACLFVIASVLALFTRRRDTSQQVLVIYFSLAPMLIGLGAVGEILFLNQRLHWMIALAIFVVMLAYALIAVGRGWYLATRSRKLATAVGLVLAASTSAGLSLYAQIKDRVVEYNRVAATPAENTNLVCRGGGEKPIPSGAFKRLSLGWHHGCALSMNNALACWGNDYYQQATPPAGKFLQVSAGGNFSCALGEDQALRCWGQNEYGQTVAPAGRFRQVSVGSYHACAVREDATLACWGQNTGGSLSPPAGQFQQVSAGYDASCGLNRDGGVVCWGFNKLLAVPAGIFKQVSVGNGTACAVQTNNILACWGIDAYHLASPPTGGFEQVSVGSYHACAVRTANKTPVCWGYNRSGETVLPQQALLQVEARLEQSCGIRGDASLACWGSPPQ